MSRQIKDSYVTDICFRVRQAELMLMVAGKAIIAQGLIKNSDMVDLLLNMTVDSFGDVHATNHNGIHVTVILNTNKVVFDIGRTRLRVKLRYEVINVD